MRIEHGEANIPWDRVAALFGEIGWTARTPDEVRAAFARSSFKAFAFEGDELIGFGRTVDDGRFYATVADVVVVPAWQRRGVGTAIVQDLQGRLKGFLMVTLTATPEVQPFYRRLGWRRMVTAMLFPRSPRQAALNCEPDPPA
jgi:GNAT superfamily N-acetyltransferase